jgi:hypothetical protein
MKSRSASCLGAARVLAVLVHHVLPGVSKIAAVDGFRQIDIGLRSATEREDQKR